MVASWRLAKVVSLCALALLSGCVIGRSSRPTQVESAQGPTSAAVNGAPVLPALGADTSEAPPPTAKPGAVWVKGYWHWDGVRYVWQRGRWREQ